SNQRPVSSRYHRRRAAEVSRAGIPAVMMFVQSLHGISHHKIENTREDHLEGCVRAFDRLADTTLEWIRASALGI
ncbi:hypothetical protein HQ447_07180, partial [bacterium]|nr:hypothetical protein [bacterium]